MMSEVEQVIQDLLQKVAALTYENSVLKVKNNVQENKIMELETNNQSKELIK